MQKDILEQFNSFNSFGANTFSTLKELAEISTKITEKVVQQQMEVVSTVLEAGVKEMTLVSESKGYKDLLAGQAALTSEYNEKALSFARNTTSILAESKDEISAWIEKGLQTASTTATKAVKKAA